MHHDVGLALCAVACHCHISENRQCGEFLHIVVTLNLVAEELYQEEDGGRNGDAQYEGDEHDDRALGAYLSAEYRLIDELTFVGCGGKRDGVLLTLLQQHQVKSRLHFLLSAYLCQHSLLFRCLTYLSLIFVGLRCDAVALNLHVGACLFHGTAD